MPDPAVFRLVCPRCQRAHIYAYREETGPFHANTGRHLCPDCEVVRRDHDRKRPHVEQATRRLDPALPVLVQGALRHLSPREREAVELWLARGDFGRDARGDKPPRRVCMAFHRAKVRLRRIGAFRDR